MKMPAKSILSGLAGMVLFSGAQAGANPIPCQVLNATRVGSDVELSFEFDRICFDPDVPLFTMTTYRDSVSIDLAWQGNETLDYIIYSATDTNAPYGYHCYRAVAMDGQESFEGTDCVGTPPDPDAGVPDAAVEADAEPDDNTVNDRGGCSAAGGPAGGLPLFLAGLAVLLCGRRRRR
jgi:hypothetical protein